MPLDDAVVLRPAHVADREAFASLPEAVAVVAAPPGELAELAKTFAKAVADKSGLFRGPSPAHALATGPELDGPDKVALRRLVRRGTELELEVVHTAVRAQGAQLRRNIRWRPMVQVPLKLPSGRYELKVTWRALAALPDGKPLETPRLTRSVKFELLPGK